MAVGSEECVGFVQPFAGVAVTVPVMVGGVGTLPAHIGHGRLQSTHEVRERGVRCWLPAIQVEPAAGAAKATICAAAVVLVEAALQVAVGEVDLALDKPARIGEQGRGVPRYGSCLVARQCCHEYPQMRPTVSLGLAFGKELSGVLPTRIVPLSVNSL